MITIQLEQLEAFIDNLQQQFSQTGYVDFASAAPSPAPRRVLGPSECLCPECGISRKGFEVRPWRARSYLTCYRGCMYDEGRPVEVFTAQDFAEDLPNASASDVAWIERDYPELLPG